MPTSERMGLGKHLRGGRAKTHKHTQRENNESFSIHHSSITFYIPLFPLPQISHCGFFVCCVGFFSFFFFFLQNTEASFYILFSVILNSTFSEETHITRRIGDLHRMASLIELKGFYKNY